MDKPKPKKEVAIRGYSEEVRIIFFDGSYDAADEFREFGRVSPCSSAISYELYVDARYDFNEVLAYIENYG